MSYIRFGEDGSDVYIYGDCNGKICCCGCGINEADEYRSMYFDKISDLLKHLRKHRRAGQCVPTSVFKEFKNIQAREGDVW
jgi:hypothetical protein